MTIKEFKTKLESLTSLTPFSVNLGSIVNEQTVDKVSSSHKIVLNSTLVPKVVKVEHSNNDYTDSDNLASLLANETCRKEIFTILNDIPALAALIQKCIASSNGIVRMSGAVTDYPLIMQSVDKMYHNKTIHAKQLLSTLLYRFLREIGIASGSFIVDTATLIDATKVNETLLKHDLVLDSCKLLVMNAIKFGPVDRFGNSSNCQLLASKFSSDLEEFRIRLLNLDKITRAVDSVLPRIKSYLTNNLSKYYLTSSSAGSSVEIDFINDANFLLLAQNVEIATMALSQPNFRGSDNPLYWSEYDSMLATAIKNSNYYSFKTLDEVVSEFNISILKDSLGHRKKVLINKNFDISSNPSAYYKTSVGSYSKFTKYPYLESFTTTLKGFLNEFELSGAHQLAAKILSRYVGNNSLNEVLMCSIYDNQDMVRLAIALADDVYISSKGSYLFGCNNIDTTTEVELIGLSKHIFTDVPENVVFLKASEHQSRSKLTIDARLGINESTRYTKVDSFTEDFSTMKADVILLANYGEDEITIFKDMGLQTFFDLDITTNIILERVVGDSIKVDSIFGCYTATLNILNREKTKFMDDEIWRIKNSGHDISDSDALEAAEKKMNDLFTPITTNTSMIFGRDIYNRINKMADSPLVRALIGKMNYMIYNHLKESQDTRLINLSSTLFYDEVLREAVNVSTVIYLMQALGLVTNGHARLARELVMFYIQNNL